VQRAIEKQQMVADRNEDIDVIGIADDELEAASRSSSCGAVGSSGGRASSSTRSRTSRRRASSTASSRTSTATSP
jgi:hypothetical protein